MLVDYHIHAAGHGEYEYSPDWIARFLETAQSRGITEIGFSEHNQYADKLDLAAVENARRGFDLKTRLGLEADYIPGQEHMTERAIKVCDYDYVIGSVHFISGWGFDHPDFKEQFQQYDIDEVYQEYFGLVTSMVNSGLFDIVGHLDLVKVWGYRPRHKITTYTEVLLKAIRASGMVVELNSAGLRKPVQEIYPAQEIIEAMYEMGIPITLGSDAHHPDQVGEDFPLLVQMARNAGYTSIMTFIQRRHYPILI